MTKICYKAIRNKNKEIIITDMSNNLILDRYHNPISSLTLYGLVKTMDDNFLDFYRTDISKIRRSVNDLEKEIMCYLVVNGKLNDKRDDFIDIEISRTDLRISLFINTKTKEFERYISALDNLVLKEFIIESLMGNLKLNPNGCWRGK